MRPLVGLLLVLTATAQAQTPADALRGTATPITAKELPDDYRAISLGNGGSWGMGLYGVAMGAEGGQDNERSAMLVSLIGVVFVDPDEFAALLDGKRPRVRGYTLDFAATVLGAEGSKGPGKGPSPVFAEAWLEGGKITQWSPRPALSKAAILAAFLPPSPAASGADSLYDVKQLSLALMKYAASDGARFPEANSSGEARAFITPYFVQPYVVREEPWTTPNGRILYNVALSRLPTGAIKSPTSTLLLWEERPGQDGMRVVGFVQGPPRRVSQAEWDRLWAAELVRRKKALNAMEWAPDRLVEFQCRGTALRRSSGGGQVSRRRLRSAGSS